MLVGYADLAGSLGLNPAGMLRRVGLDSRCLVDSEIRVPVKAVADLLELSAIEACVFDFGLRLARVRGVPDLGPLSLLMREEPNLRSALASLERYLSVHNSGVSIRLLRQGTMPLLAADFLGAVAGPTRQAREMIVAGLFRFLSWLRGAQWRPRGVCFTHGAPDSTQPHRRAFGCPLHFNQDFDGILLLQADLDAPLANADPMLRAHAQRYLNTLVGSETVSIEDSVRKLIAMLLPLGRCSAAAIAERLGIDRSTLTRHLACNGQSYTAILQSVRTGMAAQRVATGGASLTAVADALGFSSLSAFSHWFQLTFGCSARRWRRRNVGADVTPRPRRRHQR